MIATVPGDRDISHVSGNLQELTGESNLGILYSSTLRNPVIQNPVMNTGY